MNISLIVAVDQDGGIGKDGRLPWNFKQDLKFFSKTTRGKVCIMGRSTYNDVFKSIGNKEQLLPKRESIVISRDPMFTPYGAEAALSVPDALLTAAAMDDKDIVFIGGKSIYTAACNIIDTAYITRIPGSYECDVFFQYIEFLNQFFDKEVLEEYDDGVVIYEYTRIGY